MTARWYKRCGADFIHGTMALTLEEKGAYSLCLDLIYDRGGLIPDDARWLAGVCGVSLRKWSTLRQSLINAGKIYVTDGMLGNVRADLELVSTEFQRRKLIESGSKGGRKRAENAATVNENSDLAQATLKPIEKIREDKKEPPTPLEGERPKPTRRRASVATSPLPEDWSPGPFSVGTQSRVIVEGWLPQTMAEQLEAFRAHHVAKGNQQADWQSAWSTWVLNTRRFRTVPENQQEGVWI